MEFSCDRLGVTLFSTATKIAANATPRRWTRLIQCTNSNVKHYQHHLELISLRQRRLNKTFKKRKNRAFLTLLRSQKHYVIFSNNVLQENITRKQFNRWLGLVSISQTALRYLQPRSKGTWERGWDTLWCAHKVNTDYRPKHWKPSI